ncbi:MAG: hypothetical protein IJ833_03980 [Lachnospiraceae bacterium]|nr:hypothetical protein [Lachnospiraceae bacterium]
MSGLMADGWAGWLAWNANGKFMALFLAVLLFLWFGDARRRQGKAGWMLSYTTVFAAFCIFPPTAAVLLRYQTGFYHYEWLWSLVPVTVLLAYGGTLLSDTYIRDGVRGTAREKWRSAGLLVLLAAVLLLSGGLGQSVEGVEITAQRTADVADILDELKKEQQDAGEICLWAPRDILQYTRAVDGDITLLYGRNMWDRYLDGYTYDTYDETEKGLFLWMERLAGQPSSEDIGTWNVREAVSLAQDKGANTVLLPVALPEEELIALEKELGQQARKIDEYYLLVLTER